MPTTTPNPAESLLDLIEQYWGIAYTEGAAKRTCDNENGDAGRVWSEIRQAVAALASPAAQAQPVAGLIAELDRAITVYPAVTGSPGSYRKRTQWEEGWNACGDAVTEICERRAAPEALAPDAAPAGKVPDGFIDDIITCAHQFADAIKANDKSKIAGNAAWMNSLVIGGAAAAHPVAGGGEPVAFAVYWGMAPMRRHSVHFARQTAEDVAAEVKSNPTEIRPLYLASPPAKAEAVASIYVTPDGGREFDDWRHALPVGRNLLYTRPSEAREPLTHMQIVLLWGHRSDGPTTPEIVSFARAIERAHGIGIPARVDSEGAK